MRIALTALFLIFLPTAANAEPVYLDCHVLWEEGGDVNYQIKVDETTNQIIHRVVETGHIIEERGFFTADKITYKSQATNTMEQFYEIDRVNLSYRVQFRISNIGNPAEGPIFLNGYGSCIIKELDPNRKL